MPPLRAWRVFAPAYAETAFSGEGARRHGGRYNAPGIAVVYTSDSLALALLELLVQGLERTRLQTYLCQSLAFDEASVRTLPAADLPAGWDARPAGPAGQAVGAAWLTEGTWPILRVPSVVVPMESTLLFNPAHPAFPGFQRGPLYPVPLDTRLPLRERSLP